MIPLLTISKQTSSWAAIAGTTPVKSGGFNVQRTSVKLATEVAAPLSCRIGMLTPLIEAENPRPVPPVRGTTAVTPGAAPPPLLARMIVATGELATVLIAVAI